MTKATHEDAPIPEIDAGQASALAIATYKGIISQIAEAQARWEVEFSRLRPTYEAYYDAPEAIRATMTAEAAIVAKIEEQSAEHARNREALTSNALPRAMEIMAEALGAKRKRVFHKVRDLFEDLQVLSAWRRDHIDGVHVDFGAVAIDSGGLPPARERRLFTTIVTAWFHGAKISSSERDEVIAKSRQSFKICLDPDSYERKGFAHGDEPSLSMIRDVDAIIAATGRDPRSDEAKAKVKALIAVIA